jgi:NAD(P)-dependent dehydrogenase (short-subunit alcohol dehydrogenase family)
MDAALLGKTFVITGATSGIGLAVARSLVQRSAGVIGVGRSPERCREAQEELISLNPGVRVAYCLADLSLQSQVRLLADQIREMLTGWEAKSLDGLLNNAATVPFWQTLTAEGFDMQWAVNHLAPFLFTHELLPLLKVADASRVVTVSSGSHYGARLDWGDIQMLKHYAPLRVYKQTKLCNVLFSTELNRRLGSSSKVKAFAADPGLVNTEIGLKSNSWLARWVWDLRRRGGIPAEEAARGIVYLLTEPAIQEAGEIYWKHGRPKPPNPIVLNEATAQRLWNLSAQMCGIKTDEGFS